MSPTRIHQLPADVVELIAAGEVIERPASVVKELLDNALDAKASLIKIYLENSGNTLIQVTDNGHGISEQDLIISTLPHTTSKITSLEDLEKLQFLGFRGEALASMAAVANLTIQSKPVQQEMGFQITVQRQQIADPIPLGMPSGTTIAVENLFSKIPARKKFLKKPAVELKLILKTITQTALSHPEIGFELMHHQKILLHTPAGQSIEERIKSIYSLEFAEQLLPIFAKEDTFSIRGFIGKPQISRKYSAKQFLSVNHRAISHPHVAKIIKSAYGSLLAPKSQPAFLLWIETNPNLIDPNVHPRKETISFVEEDKIMAFIQRLVVDELSNHDLTFHQGSPSGQNQPRAGVTNKGKMFVPLANELRSSLPETQLQPSQLEPIVQVNLTYLVQSHPDGVVLIDQHAAHERILFEELSQTHQQKNQAQDRYVLENPVLLELSRLDKALFDEHQDTLQEMGFEFEPFGDLGLKILIVPNMLKKHNLQRVMAELLDDLDQGIPVPELDSLSHNTLAYLACRAAVKAGDYLTPERRESLINQLQKTPKNATCPHGRPTRIVITKSELEKMFKRR